MKTVASLCCICVSLLVVTAGAKDKKQLLPDAVLKAQTIAVVIEPEAGTSLTSPGENTQARNAVEEALRKWGRYRVLPFADAADLIVTIRRSSSTVKPTITRGPMDRPTTIDPGTRSPGDDSISTTIGISHGNPPPLTRVPQSPAGESRTEIGSAEDSFAVYVGNGFGGVNDNAPLDAPAIWRYVGRNALLPPSVQAVKEFQKAVEESAKAQKKP